MLVLRDLIYSLKPFLKRKEFISITGPRQCGKTTLLGLIKDCLVKEFKVNPKLIQIITFEDRRLLMQFEKDPLSFIRSYLPQDLTSKFYLMIDEFQYAQEGGQKLKLIYDTISNIKIIITGSSSLEIKAKVGKFMVGRILNFYLYPFNFKEYLRAINPRLERVYTQNNEKILAWISARKKFKIRSGRDLFGEELNQLYEDFCIWGGYPAVVLAKTEIERKKLLGDIYNSYILKDIKTLLELTTEKNLFLLSQYLATQIGNIIVYQNLSQVSGLDYRKLKSHLNILEETFICKEIRPFFKNRQKELSKNPKIFFLDLGFRNSLLENTNRLDKRSDSGAIIENVCFVRLNELFGGINKINFWRTKVGAEVDFILFLKDNLIPIEVKYSSFNTEKIDRSFLSFITTFQPKHGLILTKDYWGFIKRKNTSILFAPVYYF